MRNSVKTNPTTEMDATEFGIYSRQGGWRLGLLVARNVQRVGRGKRSDLTSGNRPKSEKISAGEFARLAGLSDHKIVTRYLDAWDRYAAEDVVPSSASLHPGSEVQLDEETLGTFRVTAPASPQEVVDDDDDEDDDELIEEDDVVEDDGDEDIVEEPGDEQEADDDDEDEEEVEEPEELDDEESEDESEEDDSEVAYTTTSKPKSVTQNIKAEKAKQSSSQHDAAAWHSLSINAIAKLTVMEQSPGWWKYANKADIERLGNIIAIATKLRKEAQKQCKATS